MDRAKAVTILLRASHSVEEVLKNDISQYNLNTTEFGVLEFLLHKGRQPINNICNKLLMANSSMTYVIDKLEKKELVERINNGTDKRVKFIDLTLKGRSFIEEIYQSHTEIFNKLFNVFNDDELNLLMNRLKKLGHHADGMIDKKKTTL